MGQRVCCKMTSRAKGPCKSYLVRAVHDDADSYGSMALAISLQAQSRYLYGRGKQEGCADEALREDEHVRNSSL